MELNMPLIIENELKQMYQYDNEKVEKEISLYGGIRFPKFTHRFSVQVDNTSLTTEEKIIFCNQVTEAFLQESILPNNNIFTVIVEDDLYNHITKMLPKLNACDLTITYLDGVPEPLTVVHLIDCKLLFTRTHVSYADASAHRFKLIFSYGELERLPILV